MIQASDYAGLNLLSQHAQLLIDSAVKPEVAKARGYGSATKKSELKVLGFSEAQCLVPALTVPVFGITGEVVLHQIRPDTPRAGKDGRKVKYETPAKARMALDIHPSLRKHLGNPQRPLFITEGVRKADSAISQGLCCVAVLGVWNFRGTNDQGGKVLLSVFDEIALNGREVYIAYDSDVMQKPAVHDALFHLAQALLRREALVKYIYLPPRSDGGKVGLDDFFAAQKPLAELYALATTQLRNPPKRSQSFPYEEVETDTSCGILWHKPMREGEIPIQLCNFTARITGDVVEDDGIETRRLFAIETRQGKRTATVKVSAERFTTMVWPTEALGAQAIIAPGQGAKDHVRAAIQCFSQGVQEQRVYAHLGWRKIGEQWVYLHAGGAIGCDGAEPNVEVAVVPALERYLLPALPQEREPVEAIRTSLRLLEVAPVAISVLCLAAPYRAALGESDFSIHLSGLTGIGKSELAALTQQHFGAGLDARHLPASWSSTGNSLEGLAFAAKDCVLVVDDFCPTGSSVDIQRFHREADRILRAQGNHAGRLRMRSDATLRAAKPPRGLILSTGEDLPRGHSLRSRIWAVEVSPGDVDWSVLSQCQHDAASGQYALAFGAFLRWLAPQYEAIRLRLRQEIQELRTAATQGAHKRTPDTLANLAIGFHYFLRFAVNVEAMSRAEAEASWAAAWQALNENVETQAAHQVASDPARRFLELLSSSLVSGRTHVAGVTGGAPVDPEAWGWRLESGEGTWFPKGEKIGWIDNQALYLEPDAAFAIAQKLARDQNDSLPVTQRTLHKRLKEDNYLENSHDSTRTTLTVRRTVEGQRRPVLHLRKDIFSERLSSHTEHDQHDQSANGTTNNRNGHVFSTPWPHFSHAYDHQYDQENQQ